MHFGMPLAKSTSNRSETLSLAGVTGCVGFLAGFLRAIARSARRETPWPVSIASG